MICTQGCDWHFQENLKNNLAKDYPEEYKWIADMQRTSNEKVFKWMWDKYVAEHPDGTWFLEQYGENGKIAKPVNWANCYNMYHPSTSMVSLSYFNKITLNQYTQSVNRWRKVIIGRESITQLLACCK